MESRLLITQPALPIRRPSKPLYPAPFLRATNLGVHSNWGTEHKPGTVPGLAFKIVHGALGGDAHRA